MRYCDDEYRLLKTKSAKLILGEKRKFITLFNHQLKEEIYGTEIFGEVSIEDYF